jgi:hypothetical protein
MKKGKITHRCVLSIQEKVKPLGPGDRTRFQLKPGNESSGSGIVIISDEPKIWRN